ncbi:hypothetical protein POM88_005504 [Heracleum sosnowskyi]|uniref:RING-type domain-containing protein n=1 Tax=Heracleum sosnowskyi TaxID=360622 RepID=A0AAD8N4J2_9APIA|nr:hypothetical protein POM88_005504 [Heracleum sosnowskyi]
MVSQPPLPPPPLPLLGIIGLLIVYLVICYLVIDTVDEAAEDGDIESHKFKKISGLSEKELQEAPCFQQTNFIIPTSICGICLDSFANRELCRSFPVCNHVFHKHCIDLWLLKAGSSSLRPLHEGDGSELWNKPYRRIKLNVEAAIFEEDMQFGNSFLVRDFAGMLVTARTHCQMGVVDPELIEVLGIREAVSWLKTRKWVEHE